MKLAEVSRGDMVRLIHFERGTEIMCRVLLEMDEEGNVTVRRSLANGMVVCAAPEMVNDNDYIIVEHLKFKATRKKKKDEVQRVRENHPSSGGVRH